MRWVLGFLFAALSNVCARESLVDSLKHDIKIITPKNFDSSISKYRDRFPAVILFYKNNKPSKTFINGEWDGVAKSLKGMVHVGGVDCTEFRSFCIKEGAQLDDNTDYLVRLYPPLPMPARSYTGPLERQKIVAQLTKLIPPAKIQTVKEEPEMATFLGDHPSIPKVILFTEKLKPSPMFNAIAHSFSDRMNFAIVSGSVEDRLQKRFRVKQMPTLLLKKRGDLTMSLRNVETYRGAMKFDDIFEWLNVHSETFVKGGGFLTEKEPEAQNLTETRPWLTQRVPEMMKGSHNDVCFKKSKGLCAVFLTSGELKDSDKVMLEELSDQFPAERKLGFHWSWMDVDREPNFAKLFKLSEDSPTRSIPSLVVINPHKRLRFSRLPAEETATRENIVRFLEKIESGDGRFTIIKGNKVPAFEKRSPPPSSSAAVPPGSAEEQPPTTAKKGEELKEEL